MRNNRHNYIVLVLGIQHSDLIFLYIRKWSSQKSGDHLSTMLHYYYYFLLYPLYLISPPPAMWQPLQKCGMFHKFACHPCSGSVLLFPFGWSFGIVKLGFLKSTETSLDFASIILLTINQQIMFITLCNFYLYIKQETSCKGHQYLCQRPQA